MILAAVVTGFMDSVSGAWTYLITFTAGVGPVMILRWYWPRINAWSEISALVCSGVVATTLKLLDAFPGPNQVALALLLTVAVTSIVWLAVTFLTQPESEATLARFYGRVRPGDENLGIGLRDWIAGCGLIYGMLFGIGKLCLWEVSLGIGCLAVAAVCLFVILRDINRRPQTISVRAVATAALALTMLVIPSNVRAASDKILANVKGSVSYEDSGKTTPVAPNASIALADKDIAITGDVSLGQLQLPDSSVVTLGAQTRVQLAFFNQSDIANAQFVVYQGKTRFKVEHPQGAKANYTFVTPTSSIAVRGTEGDIGVDGDSLTVNVYAASQPVSVTFSGGKVQMVNAGQSLT
ncbi:MAG: FecR domain-containing protein, partial [Vulcanimicrobiaceae bacterium]